MCQDSPPKFALEAAGFYWTSSCSALLTLKRVSYRRAPAYDAHVGLGFWPTRSFNIYLARTRPGLTFKFRSASAYPPSALSTLRPHSPRLPVGALRPRRAGTVTLAGPWARSIMADGASGPRTRPRAVRLAASVPVWLLSGFLRVPVPRLLLTTRRTATPAAAPGHDASRAGAAARPPGGH